MGGGEDFDILVLNGDDWGAGHVPGCRCGSAGLTQSIQEACSVVLKCFYQKSVSECEVHLTIKAVTVSLWATDAHEHACSTSVTYPGLIGFGGEHFIEAEKNRGTESFDSHVLFLILVHCVKQVECFAIVGM